LPPLSRYDPSPPEPVAELTRGIPHAVVLRNAIGEYSVLVPATSRPVRPASKTDLLKSNILLDRRSKEWVNQFTKGGPDAGGDPNDGGGADGDSRHFIYPVHGSLGFLFTPSLASSLFLLLLRFLNRQYDAVFRMAESCVSDTELSGVERTVFNQLRTLREDQHPDAHACRLRISLATLGSREHMAPEWSLEEELGAYVTKHASVSAACRLTMQEELELLDHCALDIKVRLEGARLGGLLIQADAQGLCACRAYTGGGARAL